MHASVPTCMHMMVLLILVCVCLHSLENFVGLSKQHFQKVSQLMGRVARLNEAFSVVRRVPIVRPPSLPASSVTLRPVMSMR